MLNKRKVLFTAAIAGLYAAGAMIQSPAFADETAPAAGGEHGGEKAHSCKGGAGCKGEEAAAGAPAAGAEHGDAKAHGEGKATHGKKHKAKKKKKAAEAHHE